MTSTTALLSTYQAKPEGDWQSIASHFDNRTQDRLERWVLDGVDDLPSLDAENPVDTLSAYLRSAIFVTPQRLEAGTEDYKNVVSSILRYKRWWLWGCPQAGTIVTVVDDTVSHSYPVGTKLRVLPSPFLDDYSTDTIEGERLCIPSIRVVPVDPEVRCWGTFLTVFDVEDWHGATPTVHVTVSDASEDRLQQLVDVFSEVYNQAAETRGWCSEAEEVTRAANAALAAAGFSVRLSERSREYEGYLDIPITVYVRMPFTVTASLAADGEAVRNALETAYNRDPRTSDTVLREAMANGNVSGSSDYSLGIVAVEWNAPDVEDAEGDWRYA